MCTFVLLSINFVFDGMGSRIHTNHPKVPFKTGSKRNVSPAVANMFVTSQSGSSLHDQAAAMIFEMHGIRMSHGVIQYSSSDEFKHMDSLN
jgi:hypothetical protein